MNNENSFARILLAYQSMQRGVLPIVVSMSLAACGGGAGGGLVGGGGGGGGFVADISNTFEGFDGNGRKISLLMFAVGNSSGKGQATGTLDGTLSELAIYDGTDNSPPTTKVSGSYNGSSITLALAIASLPLVQNYTGTFSDADTMVLQPASAGAASITLRRAGFFSANFVDSWNGTTGSGQAWLIQLGTADGYEATASARVEGAEQLNGRISRVTGYVNIRAVHLVIERPTGPVTLDGEFPREGTSTNGDAMRFGATTLSRGGPPDVQKIAFIAQPNGVQQLHLTDAKGNAPAILIPPPAGADPVVEFVASPNKLKIISVGSGPVGANLYLTDVSTKQTSLVSIIPAVGAAVLAGSISWSPDGSHVAFLAVESQTDAPDIFVLQLSNLQVIKVSQALAASTTPPIYKWAPGATATQTLACAISETAGADRTELFIFRLESSPVRKRIIGLSKDFDVTAAIWSPDQSKLAFILGQRGQESNELFVSTGSQGNLPADEYVPISTVPSFGAISDVEWNSDSSYVAFILETSGAHLRELHTLSANASQSIVVSDFAVGTPTQSAANFSWAPNAAKIAFNVSMGAGLTQLYVVAPSGAGTPQLLTSSAIQGLASETAKPRWSPNSQRLLYENRSTGRQFEVFTIGADGIDKKKIHGLGSDDCTPSQQPEWLPAAWAPDSTHIASVVSAENAKGDCTLNIAKVDGSANWSLDLKNRDDYGATISEYFWLPDGGRVAYIQSTFRDAFQWGELRVGSAGDKASLRVFGKLGANIPTRYIAPL